MKFPAQMSLVEGEKKKVEQRKNVLEQHSCGGVEALLCFKHWMNSDLPAAEAARFIRLN